MPQEWISFRNGMDIEKTRISDPAVKFR